MVDPAVRRLVKVFSCNNVKEKAYNICKITYFICLFYYEKSNRLRHVFYRRGDFYRKLHRKRMHLYFTDDRTFVCRI